MSSIRAQKVSDFLRKEISLLISSEINDPRLKNIKRNAGSAYLIGNSLTAADVYWAYFSNMLQSLPAEKNPMPNGLRQSWAVLAKTISGYDPTLIAHRDNIFNEHLELPLSF